MDRLRGEYCASLVVAACFGVSLGVLGTPHAALAAAGDVVLVGAALTVYAAVAIALGARWRLWNSMLLSGSTVVAATMTLTASALPLMLTVLAAIAICQWTLVIAKKQSRRRHSR